MPEKSAGQKNFSLICGLYPLNIKDYNPHNKNCQGEGYMIKFDRLWKTMEKRNISTYYLREKSGIDSKTVRRLKNNENIETKTIDKLCKALDCDINDILEYIKD